MATINNAIVVEIGVDASSAQKKIKAFGGTVSKTTQKSATNVRSLTKAFGGLVIAAGGLAIFGKVASGIFNVNRETQKLFASLKTVTGSAENATKAFRGIEKFASETPFQVEQITTAFIRMKSLGLDPSEDALRSYGNTASAMGMDLMQFVEAVADATTNEFERLKEFGIKAKSEGDRVSFTFQGITTTVRKNAKEINEFLTSIGENQFAGAMEEQMKTIDGRLSNLKDNFSTFARLIGTGGVNTAMESLIDKFVNLTAEIVKNRDEVVASTQFILTSLETAFVGTAGLIDTVTKTVQSMFSALKIAAAAADIPKAIFDSEKFKENLDSAFGDFERDIGSIENIAVVLQKQFDKFFKSWENFKAPEDLVDDLKDAKEEVKKIISESKALTKEAEKTNTFWEEGADIAGTILDKVSLTHENIKRELRAQGELNSEWEKARRLTGTIETSTANTGKNLTGMEIATQSTADFFKDIAASSGKLLADLVKGRETMEQMKELSRKGLRLVFGEFPGSFLGGLFRHGGQVRQARSGLNIPSDPRGQTGVPIIAHPGETVFNRRDTEMLKPLLNILQGRPSEGIVMNNTFNTAPGATVDETALISGFRKMIIPEVAQAFRTGRLV